MSDDPLIGVIIAIIIGVFFFPWYFSSVEPWLLGLSLEVVVSIYMTIAIITVIAAIVLWHFVKKESKKPL